MKTIIITFSLMLSIILTGCVNEHIALLEKHQVGTRYEEGTLPFMGSDTFPKVGKTYKLYDPYHWKGSDMFTVSVDTNGVIAAIYGVSETSSVAEANHIGFEIGKHLVNVYRDRLIDYGAPKSEVFIKLRTEGADVIYSLESPEYEDALDRNHRKRGEEKNNEE